MLSGWLKEDASLNIQHIVGRDYREALTDHAKIDDYDLLPARLGGKAPDPPLPRPVPTGAGAGLEPFLADPSS